MINKIISSKKAPIVISLTGLSAVLFFMLHVGFEGPYIEHAAFSPFMLAVPTRLQKDISDPTILTLCYGILATGFSYLLYRYLKSHAFLIEGAQCFFFMHLTSLFGLNLGIFSPSSLFYGIFSGIVIFTATLSIFLCSLSLIQQPRFQTEGVISIILLLAFVGCILLTLFDSRFLLQLREELNAYITVFYTGFLSILCFKISKTAA